MVILTTLAVLLILSPTLLQVNQQLTFNVFARPIQVPFQSHTRHRMLLLIALVTSFLEWIHLWEWESMLQLVSLSVVSSLGIVLQVGVTNIKFPWASSGIKIITSSISNYRMTSIHDIKLYISLTDSIAKTLLATSIQSTRTTNFGVTQVKLILMPIIIFTCKCMLLIPTQLFIILDTIPNPVRVHAKTLVSLSVGPILASLTVVTSWLP